MDGLQASYRETQGFRQWWLWLLLVGSVLLTVGVFGYGIYRQIIQETPWGDNPMSDTALVVTGAVTIIFTLGMAVAILSARLITEVRSDGLHIRFFPLRWRTIPFETIASYQARTYRPVRDYGGWGIRWGREGKAYTTGGNEGLQLILNDGEKLLIGSRRAEELEAAVRTWKL